MLESKISEAGPVDGSRAPGRHNQRAEPHHVTAACRTLTASGAVYQLTSDEATGLGLPSAPAFFASAAPAALARSARAQAQIQRISPAYSAWRRANNSKALCANVLEDVVHQAALDSGALAVVGDRLHYPRIPVNGVTLPSSEADHVVAAGPELILIEDKNRRPWLGPRRHEIWQMLARCLEADCALPLLVTRKTPAGLRGFFHLIGALAFQTNNQLFAASVGSAPDFGLVTVKDGLGFHDIRFAGTDAVYGLQARLSQFFQRTLAGQAAQRRERFRSVAPILRRYLPQSPDDDVDADEFRSLKRELLDELYPPPIRDIDDNSVDTFEDWR